MANGWHAFDRFTSGLFFRRRFFPGGWGDIGRVADNYGLDVAAPRWDDAATIAAFGRAIRQAREPAAPVIAWKTGSRLMGAQVKRGTFATPVNRALLPEACRTAHVEWVAPDGHDTSMPVCVLFPATGEQGFLSRRLMALALARRGIASLSLEVVFYGARRPPDQQGALLNHVSDLIAMMDGTVGEGRALLRGLHDAGYRRLAVAGISMGGSVSALVAARTPFPVATIGLIPAHGVAPVYAEGLLSGYVDWDLLGAQLAPGSDTRRTLIDWLSAFDLSNFPRPVAERNACFLSATDDGCIPADNTAQLHAHWPAARVEWIRGGHSSAAITGWNRWRRAIVAGANGLAA